MFVVFTLCHCHRKKPLKYIFSKLLWEPENSAEIVSVYNGISVDPFNTLLAPPLISKLLMVWIKNTFHSCYISVKQPLLNCIRHIRTSSWFSFTLFFTLERGTERKSQAILMHLSGWVSSVRITEFRGPHWENGVWEQI